MPEEDQRSCDTCLIVGQDVEGHWLVRENHGLMGGIFVSRDAALHFAQTECCAFPGATVVLAGQPLPCPLLPIMEQAAA